MAQILRGLLIGCGFFARNHLHGWRDVDGAEISAVCDLDPDKARRYAEAFSIPAWHTDAGVLASGQFDFVDICTTMETHEALVALAVRHQIPVIVQKPFAPDLATCRRITAGAEAAGVPLAVHENFRFQKLFRRVRAIVDSGEIGELTFGRLSWRTAIDVYTNQPYLLRTRRFMIMDVGIHLLDLARFIFGNASAVSCINQSVKAGLAGEDATTILLRHENGATSIVDASYASHCFPDPFPQTLGEIEGRQGTIQIQPGQKLVIHAAGRQRTEIIPPDNRNWTSPPWTQIQDSVPATLQHFIHVLRAGGEFETSARDSLNTYILAEAAYRSAHSGRLITTQELEA